MPWPCLSSESHTYKLPPNNQLWTREHGCTSEHSLKQSETWKWWVALVFSFVRLQLDICLLIVVWRHKSSLRRQKVIPHITRESERVLFQCMIAFWFVSDVNYSLHSPELFKCLLWRLLLLNCRFKVKSVDSLAAEYYRSVRLGTSLLIWAIFWSLVYDRHYWCVWAHNVRGIF